MANKQHKRGPGKPQGMNLAQARAWEKAAFDELVRAAAWDLFLQWHGNLLQQNMDATLMAANDRYQTGPEDCGEFGGDILEYQREIAALINSDYQDDKELVYSKAKIDQRLEEICGDQFQPWDVRYKTRGQEDFKWPDCPACKLAWQGPDSTQNFCGICGRPLTQKGKRIFAQRSFERLMNRCQTKGGQNETD